jgi:CubicO group peptidase (beta-lactamase class C family)
MAGASVAIFEDGELTCAAAGLANAQTGVELTADTVMHIGSITKVLNATLIMQLVDEGKVDLEERVIRYLPDLELRDREALECISVEMLLNHTSGIDGELWPDQGHDEETLEKGVLRLASREQLFSPGAEFSYCNAGSVIAGYLAQRVTGKSWYRLIEERIFEPLSMRHAATLPEQALLHRTSVGHHFDEQSARVVRSRVAFLPMSFAPAGSTLMMSARDLALFARAHIALGSGANGVRILSERSARQMQTITVANAHKGYAWMDMGLGWMLGQAGVLYHSGGGPGFGAALYAHPQRDSIAVMLMNSENCLGLMRDFLGPWLEKNTGGHLFGPAIRLPSTPICIDMDRYVGVYEDLTSRYEIAATADGLTFSRQMKITFYDNGSTEPAPPLRLIALGCDQFAQEQSEQDIPDAFRIFAFRNPNSRGRMQHLGWAMRLLRRTA